MIESTPAEPARRPRHTLPEVLCLLVCALSLAAYFTVQVQPLLTDGGTGIVGGASHQNDFKHLYLGSWLLRHGQNPYDQELMLRVAADWGREVDPRFKRSVLPYVYLPFTGIVLWPLTFLSFAHAAVLFQVVNHACVIGAVCLIAWMAPVHRRLVVLSAGLACVALSHAVFRNTNAGQLNGVLLFGFTLVLALLRARVPAWAVGSLAGALMLFKLSPGILLFWFLTRRQWIHAGWMLGTALALTAVSVALVGFSIHVAFLPELHAMGYGKSTWANVGHMFWRDTSNISLNALFHRLLVEEPRSGLTPWIALSAGVANALTYAVALPLLVGFLYLANRNVGEEPAVDARLPFSLGLAVCVSLLIPSLCWDHYLVQATLPALILLGFALPEDRRWLRILAPTAGVTLLLLSSIAIGYGGDETRIGLLGTPLSLSLPPVREGVLLLVPSLKLAGLLMMTGMMALVLARSAHSPGQSPP